MAIEGFEQRKLAAIMFTDMVGYCALAQRDEGLVVTLLEEHRTLLRPAFPKHQGQEIKTIGDGFLVEFASAVAAVNCAVEIQEALARRNLGAPAGRQLQVRIGAIIDNREIINAKAILLLHYGERPGLMHGDENQATAKQPARGALARLRLPQAPPGAPPDRS
ncbi:MAG: adenylate/guanylate cyclase domain-containing protein [Chthoniobacterales bacterium]